MLQSNEFRESWSRSTDTPLRFFVHLLWVIEAVLGVILIFGFKYRADALIILIIVIALIVLGAFTLILVFILVAFFPRHLIYDKESHLIEKALSYGDESHILKFKELINIQPVEPSKLLSDDKKN